MADPVWPALAGAGGHWIGSRRGALFCVDKKNPAAIQTFPLELASPGCQWFSADNAGLGGTRRRRDSSSCFTSHRRYTASAYRGNLAHGPDSYGLLSLAHSQTQSDCAR